LLKNIIIIIIIIIIITQSIHIKKYNYLCYKYYYFYYNSLRYSRHRTNWHCVLHPDPILLGPVSGPNALGSCVRTQCSWVLRQDPSLLDPTSGATWLGSCVKRPISLRSCVRSHFTLGPRLDLLLFWVHLGQYPTRMGPTG
jgi:hypothetical protein